MKRLNKFFAILFVIVLSVSSVVFADSAQEYSDSEYVEYTKQIVETYFSAMTYDDCKFYEKSQSGWIQKGYEQYKQYVEDDGLGEFVGFAEAEIETGDSDVKKCTVIVNYKKKSIKCTLEFQNINSPSYGRIPTPTSISFSASGDDEKSFGEKMADAGKNTLIGMFTVVVILLLISAIISLFKFIPMIQDKLAKKEEKKENTNKAIDNAIAQIEEKEELVDDLELVAVITAAIAASTGTSSDGFVVRSIRRAKRK